jgi:hypothetical protein
MGVNRIRDFASGWAREYVFVFLVVDRPGLYFEGGIMDNLFSEGKWLFFWFLLFFYIAKNKNKKKDFFFFDNLCVGSVDCLWANIFFQPIFSFFQLFVTFFLLF